MMTLGLLVKGKRTLYDDTRTREGDMAERTDWEERAKGILRGEMARRGVTYAQLAEKYVLDKENADFMRHANPWALTGIIEKLSEAADRGLWAEPDPELLAELQRIYLDVEGDLEDRTP